jgi:two-component sensor histidine kinase
LLLAQDWTGADLGELAKGQIAPFRPDAGDRLKIRGPKVLLGPAQVIALGAVLHELARRAGFRASRAHSQGATPVILHFEDLREKGLFRTWNTLNSLIDTKGFPPGRIIATRRVWTEGEVLAWIEAQPTADRLACRGDATRRHLNKVAREAAASSAGKAA